MSSRGILCMSLAFIGSVSSVKQESFKSKVIAALQPIVDAYALHFNTSFSIGIANAENPTGFGIAAGVNSHIDGSRVSTTSLYPVGSATKLYTSVAVLQAHERGIIDLDAPVAPVIDPFLMRTNGTTLFELWQNEAINQVTARQLLGMRSGISDYDDVALNKFSLDPANWNEDITPYDYLHRWAIKEFLFEPGTGGSYTSIGYELLGFLLAAAFNVTSWQSLDQKAIFPVELRSKLPNMVFSGTGKCSANRNIVHQYAAVFEPVSTWTAVNYVDIDDGSCLNAWTAGSLATAPSDMAGALYNIFGAHPVSPLLSQRSLEQMAHVQPLTTGWSVGLEYGLGCMTTNIFPDPNSGIDKKYTEIIGHAGQDYGSGAPLHYYNRALDLTVTLALNSEFGMNCSLPDISENERYTDILCQVYSEILTIATNSTVGPLACGKLQQENSPTHATNTQSQSRRRLLGGDFHCSSPKDEKVCYGSSTDVATSECFTWKTFHAAFNGREWKKCHDKWDDPCGCELVTCSDDDRHILELHLSNNSLFGLVNASIDLSGLSSLRHLDLSANALYGMLVDVTAQLPSLTYLNVSYNFFSFAMPFLNFKQLSRGCSVKGNDFNCPLPPAAYASCDGGALTCDAGLKNFTSFACQMALGEIYTNPAVQYWEGMFATAFYGVLETAELQCLKQVYAERSCNVTSDWSEFEGVVMGFAGAVEASSPNAALCFIDTTKNQYVQPIGEVKVLYNKITAVPVSPVCTPAERGKIVQYPVRPSQCFLQGNGINDCVQKFTPATTPCASV